MSDQMQMFESINGCKLQIGLMVTVSRDYVYQSEWSGEFKVVGLQLNEKTGVINITISDDGSHCDGWGVFDLRAVPQPQAARRAEPDIHCDTLQELRRLGSVMGISMPESVEGMSPNLVKKIIRRTRELFERRAEPVLWQYRMRGEWASEDCWTPWDNCSEASAYNYIRTPINNGWVFETRALYTAPQRSEQE